MLWSDESTFQIVFGNHGCRFLRAKEEKDHPDCHQRKVQKPASVMVWGCVNAHGTRTSVKAPLMLKGTYRFCSNICCHPDAVFFRDILAYFSETMASLILHMLQQHGFIVRVRVLDWPACSPDLSPIENVWRIIKCKIRQQRP